jgi:hypothetical protein
MGIVFMSSINTSSPQNLLALTKQQQQQQICVQA